MTKYVNFHDDDLVGRVGRNLRRLRRVRSWSQASIAAHVGTSQSTIALLEAGKGNPTLRTLERIAKLLEIDLKDLL